MAMTLQDLQAALNDPSSPMREKLLNHLSMSPLDPAAAYQEILKTDVGGMATGQKEVKSDPMIGDIISGQQSQFPELGPMQPLPPGGGGNKPFNFDYTDPNSVAGMTNAASQLMPGETGGMPDAAAGGGDLAKMLQGIGQIGGNKKATSSYIPNAPAPKGNNWNTFQAAQQHSAAVSKVPTLAELLGRR